MRHAEAASRFCRADRLLLPEAQDLRVLRPTVDARSAKLLPPPLCGCDALSLALVNELSLRLSHIREQLKDYICDEGSCQIPTVSCVQEGHIEDNNGTALLLRDDAPLLQYEDISPFTVLKFESIFHFNAMSAGM